MKQRVLMLGAGHSPLRRRLAAPTSAPDSETEWVTLDVNPECNPDITFDLKFVEMGWKLPVPDEYFDEIHAYEVMEHYGRPGDYRGWFRGWREYWRILKPGGLFMGTSPAWNSRWAWGDPGHTRVIQQEQLFWLEEKSYLRLGKTAMTDYRSLVEPYWWNLKDYRIEEESFIYCLEKA